MIWGIIIGCTSKPETVEQNALQVIDAIDEQNNNQDSKVSDEKPEVVEPSPPIVKAEPIYPNLHFIEVSDLHMGYFSEPSIVENLAGNLGGYVNEGVDIEVSFLDNSGVIRIFQNKPVPEIKDIQPIGQALGGYRHDVAARFDLRVLSFSVEIIVGKCRFTTLPDAKLSGAYLSPCYTFGREAEPQCGEYTLEGLQFSTRQYQQVLTCLENP